MDSVDRLSGLFADLVSDSRYEPVLAELFRQPPGKWNPLRVICASFPEASARLDEITLGKNSDPVAAWLDDPLLPTRVEYCVIIVYWDAERSDFVALFNKAAFETKLADRRSKLSLLP
jgi:hypothetical protein